MYPTPAPPSTGANQVIGEDWSSNRQPISDSHHPAQVPNQYPQNTAPTPNTQQIAPAPNNQYSQDFTPNTTNMNTNQQNYPQPPFPQSNYPQPPFPQTNYPQPIPPINGQPGQYPPVHPNYNIPQPYYVRDSQFQPYPMPGPYPPYNYQQGAYPQPMPQGYPNVLVDLPPQQQIASGRVPLSHPPANVKLSGRDKVNYTICACAFPCCFLSRVRKYIRYETRIACCSSVDEKFKFPDHNPDPYTFPEDHELSKLVPEDVIFIRKKMRCARWSAGMYPIFIMVFVFLVTFLPIYLSISNTTYSSRRSRYN
eukprot:GDKJ01049943.1.p1 GENE.GDKJ01049943.1~~GDKJ01049943.1.p1  ORF type:complete len:309 (-),score=41.17 GDKJ01049943.1:499-1425(-)